MEKQVKTVKQISQEIKDSLENTFPFVWVKGELGSLKIHSSGHKYFSLKEEDCVINAICWRGTAITASLEEGSIVECYGKITIYPGRSSYQMIVKEIIQVNAQGNILFQLEELKKKLLQEGVFDRPKKAIPKFCQKIAILTSPTGAVFHDIMHRISERFPCCEVDFYAIPVQGAEAEKEIIAALEKAEKTNADVVILARGGGSLEDLWVFNSEQIVRKVANFALPIITAIGHETDTTLVDFASDLRAPTPTAAAEFTTPDKQELVKFFKQNLDSGFFIIFDKIKSNKLLLDAFSSIDSSYLNIVGNFEQDVDMQVLSCMQNIKDRINNYKMILNFVESPGQIIEKYREQIKITYGNFFDITKFRMQEAKKMLNLQTQYMSELELELKEKIIIVDAKNEKIVHPDVLKKLSKFTVKFLEGDVQVNLPSN